MHKIQNCFSTEYCCKIKKQLSIFIATAVRLYKNSLVKCIYSTNTTFMYIRGNYLYNNYCIMDAMSVPLDVTDANSIKHGIISSAPHCFDPFDLIAPFNMYLKLLIKE